MRFYHKAAFRQPGPKTDVGVPLAQRMPTTYEEFVGADIEWADPEDEAGDTQKKAQRHSSEASDAKAKHDAEDATKPDADWQQEWDPTNADDAEADWQPEWDPANADDANAES